MLVKAVTTSSLLLASLYSFTFCLAQTTVPLAPPPVPPSARAVTATEVPTIDGDVLTDPAWAAVEPITGFWQTRPLEGRPSTERTEVRILYSPTTLYIGVVCYDSDPSQIIVADTRRDSPLNDTDSFRFILDTYRDRQNGFMFGTNPAGIEYDAQVSNEGQGGGFGGDMRVQGGSGGGVNINWDGSWTVEAQIGEHGWSAEFAIPFRTLRFNPGEQVWGINFERTIRRKNERSYWAPLPRQYDLPRLSLAGTLEDLDIPSPRNLQLTPYVLSYGARNATSAIPAQTNGPEADFGADLKYSITPSLTLDLTYNTDFAQVEVDEQQINLDRFNLFFPEKRPFFLENAGVFSVGQPGAVELFFSRRIGIGPSGEGVPIVGGGRISGDVGGFRVGALNMQTAQVGGFGIPANNFGVVRLRRELPNRSAVGGIVTNRQGVGDLSVPNDHNRLAAVDGRLGIGQYGLISGFAARSFTPGLAGGEHAFRLESGYNSERWMFEGGFTEVGANFNPEVGFLRRSAYRHYNGLVFHRFRPEVFGFHELRPHASFNGYWGLDGFHESMFLHIDNHWEWRNGLEIHTGLNLTHEGVREPFNIVHNVVVPAGSYSHQEAMLVFMTDRGKPISFNTQAIIGGFFGGSRVALSPTLWMRSGESFNTQLSVNRNMIDLPGGSFTTNLLRARLSYSFTPRHYLQTLIQYNDAADVWSANLRFGWLQTAGTGLFIVLNHASDIDGIFVPGMRQQSVVVKYSRLFNVLN